MTATPLLVSVKSGLATSRGLHIQGLPPWPKHQPSQASGFLK